MKTRTIQIPTLISVTSMDMEGNTYAKKVTEYDLQNGSVGDDFYFGIENPSFEEVLTLVGWDEENYYTTLTTYQNDKQLSKELIIFS